VHELIITEFKGKYPEVPHRSDVNLEELTKGDDAPFFMTLEISRKGQESRSGLLHDDALGESIAEQINAQAATGIMGHLRDDERGTAYPTPAVYWLGAKREGGSTWAKGYIPKTKPDVREHFRIQMASGGKAATSIYGAAAREMVDSKRGTYRLKAFRLEQLDLAPFERAALPLDGNFRITKQMTGDEDMDVKELKASDLTPELRAQVIAEYQATQGTQDRIAETEGKLTTATARVAELEGQVSEYRVKEFYAGLDDKIAEMVTFDAKTDASKGKLAALRSIVRRAVLGEMAGKTDLAEAVTALTTYVAGDEYKALASAIVGELAGPAAIVTGKDKRSDNWRDELAGKAGDLKKKAGL
jgi:hypothetical protein